MIGSLLTGGIISVAVTPFFHTAEHPASSPAERKVLFWYDPMKPDVKFDQPGKSPFMDMDLVPKYADEGDTQNSKGIRVDPSLVQNLGMKTGKVSKGH
jgi:Cu(I)/Ag(I) efflux system membrane fusion protein